MFKNFSGEQFNPFFIKSQAIKKEKIKNSFKIGIDCRGEEKTFEEGFFSSPPCIDISELSA